MITNISVKFTQHGEHVGGLNLDGFFVDEQLADVLALCDKIRQHYNSMGDPFGFEISYKDEDV